MPTEILSINDRQVVIRYGTAIDAQTIKPQPTSGVLAVVSYEAMRFEGVGTSPHLARRSLLAAIRRLGYRAEYLGVRCRHCNNPVATKHGRLVEHKFRADLPNLCPYSGTLAARNAAQEDSNAK